MSDEAIDIRNELKTPISILNMLKDGKWTKAEIEAAIHNAAMLLSTPSKAGIEIQIGDKQYFSAYNETAGSSVVGRPVTRDYSNDYGTEVIAPATTNFPVTTAVTLNAVAEHALTWWQKAGDAEAFVDGDSVDVAAGDFLEVLNTGTAFVKDGAARTTVSGAVAIDANTAAAALKTVRLIPEPHTIAGS